MIKDIFMPLGSLLNAYGNINSGKGITTEQLIEDTRKLVEFAQELVSNDTTKTKEPSNLKFNNVKLNAD